MGTAHSTHTHRDMFLLSAALCLVSVLAAPTPIAQQAPVLAAPTALAAVARPVPPKDLPAQYLRVDSRIPYQYYRRTLHPCTGPNDDFSCANLTSVEESYIKYQMVVPRLPLDDNDVSHPGWGRIGCGECKKRVNRCNTPTTGYYCSVAYFCSRRMKGGEWSMKRVFYKDHDCQHVAPTPTWTHNNTIQIPMSGQPGVGGGGQPSYRNDSSCYSHSASCSSTWHPGKCTSLSAYCPVEGANKTVCDDWNRAHPHPGGGGYISCDWRPSGGYFEGIQQYQAIEEPSKRGSDSKSN